MSEPADGRKMAINPPTLLDAPRLGFNQAIRVGATVYCSGQVSMAEGLEAQTREALANVRRLLEAAGATMADVVKMTIYTVDEHCWPKTAAARAEFIPPTFPAATMVVVRALADPRLLIEIDVTAVIGAGG